MRKHIGKVLLLGAMAAVQLAAQSKAAQNQSGLPEGHLDVAVTYDAAYAGGSDSFWLQGGSVQVHGQFYRGLGVVADVTGLHNANMHGSGVGLDMVTATFGPRYTWTPAKRRYSLFGQGLVGEANGFNSVFPGAGGVADSANSLALEVGGGVNYALPHHITLRAIEAGWLRTQLPNGGDNVQNNLHLGVGIVLRFK